MALAQHERRMLPERSAVNLVIRGRASDRRSEGYLANRISVSSVVEHAEEVRASSRSERVYRTGLVVLWVGVAFAALMKGIEYYRLPLQERAFSPLYDAMKPAGTIGHLYGIVGTAMVLIGVVMYSLRKRFGVLARLGRLKYWLEAHIFLCTLGPFLVLLHTTFRFGGIVSIAFWSMTVVVASGVFGRYVYARIPKTVNGRFLSIQAIERERQRLLTEVADRAGLQADDVRRALATTPPLAPRGFLHAMVLAARSDRAKRRHVRRAGALLTARRVPRRTREELEGLIRARFQLERQMVLLRPFQRLFRYWHVLHLPLAIVMLLIVILHVAVAIAFGYA